MPNGCVMTVAISSAEPRQASALTQLSPAVDIFADAAATPEMEMSVNLDRRTLLRLISASILFPSLPSALGAAPAAEPLFVLLGDLDPALQPAQLLAVMEPFIAAEIRLAIIVGAAAGSTAAVPAHAGALRQLLDRSPELLEVVLAVPGLAAAAPYFQRRRTSDAMTALRRVLAADGTGPALAPPVTLATEGKALAQYDSVRALGIRTVLDLQSLPRVTSTGCSDRTICVQGARTLSLAGSDPAGALRAALAPKGWAQVLVSLAGSEGVSPSDLQQRAEGLITVIHEELNGGRRFAALPREQVSWFGADQPRRLALHIEAPPAGNVDAAAGFDRLTAALNGAGIPFTLSSAPNESNAPVATCLALDGVADADALHWLAQRDESGTACASRHAPSGMSSQLAAALDLLLTAEGHHAFDDRGVLRQGEVPVEAGQPLLSGPAAMRDAVLTISAEVYASDAGRAAALDLLGRLKAAEATEISGISGFAAAVVSADPVFRVLQQARRGVAAAEPDAADLTRSDLLADARHAWTFFERFSNAGTGLCADTVQVSDGTYLHGELTMWDVGSLIAAVMAAHELGLVDDAGFVRRIKLLLGASKGRGTGGLTLPSEVVSTETAARLSPDFNACDTGRLLAVLKELEAHPLAQDAAAKVVAGWTLGAALQDGMLCSVTGGRLRKRPASHCDHYTARALRSWGYEAASPYEDGDSGGASETDRQMQLLTKVAAIGPFGAEPLLLEAVEMGLSGPSSLLADVLFDQQRRAHAATGRIICVSEAPLDRRPWFTYQGLRLDTPEQPWVVSATSPDARYRTQAFQTGALLASTKAAYLWAAARPSAFSTLLVQHVRGRARLDDMGFSPGVFAATGQGMQGYADVNTNGIVMEAVAFILRGRKPRVTG